MSTVPNQPNQPESAVTNYCQNCGKPLTAPEVRTVGGMIYCEPCLAQRLGIPHPAGQTVPGQPPVAGAPYVPVRNSPVLAALLGTIPGVGAMYNGQVAKGLLHVVIFVALVSATDHFGPFGLLVAGWVFYQVFDAYQTAHALQRGLPPPDPLGLNQIAARFGFPGAAGLPSQQPPYAAAPPVDPYAPVPPVPPVAPEQPYPYVPPSYVPPGFGQAGYPPPPGFVPPSYPPQPGYVPPPVADFAPGPNPPAGGPPQNSLPTGAFVLVGLGVFFLLGTAGVLSTHWLSRGWPLILIALGIFIFFRNSNSGRNP
jgi:TM2 domain-containing membrane protein YozV